MSPRSPRTVALAAAVGVALATAGAATPESSSPAAAQSASNTPIATLARVSVPDTQTIHRMEADGVDVTHGAASTEDGRFEITVVLPAGETNSLAKYGARVLSTQDSRSMSDIRGDIKGIMKPMTAAQKASAMNAAARGKSGEPASGKGSTQPAVTSPNGTLTVLRSDTWTSNGQRFASVDVRSKAGRTDTITVTANTGENIAVSNFTDMGVYLYHRVSRPVPVTAGASSVTLKSTDGTTMEVPLREWSPGKSEAYPAGFKWGFTDSGYVDSQQSDQVIEGLAKQFPGLAEVVELPHDTVGYPASATGAPGSYPRGPKTVKAIRIGKHRDGSRTGVMMYAQEHAREWVTSLVGLETAQRLLHNYGTDPRSTQFVDDLDIFIIPQVNPDGVAYSLYDSSTQRGNMNRSSCSSGVDLNRNFSVGSVRDGYLGGSSTCGQTYAGPSELSEAESKNEVWLTKQHPNIKFAMNTHSHGGYFMWSPATYRDDRTTLPRPTLGTENYFFEASEKIIREVRGYRDTVIWPGRTGPVVDVLYSASGNSGDELYYPGEGESGEPEIYAWDFEVGNELWNPQTQKWTSSGAFWPDFESEGFHQAMEYSNGWYGIFQVAHDYAHDTKAPTTRVNLQGTKPYDGPVDALWKTSEAAEIYYTTDGSRPTLASAKVEQDGIRGGALPVNISAKGTTVLQWFSVDEKGNVEGGYDPNGTSNKGLQRVVLKIK